MEDSFNPYDYLLFVSRRWRFVALTLCSAAVIALVVSLASTKRYTASASILIEPPASSDARAATAVSPIYLESLKTYEQFASSDTVFARACAKFHLLDGPGAPSIESFKRRVLKVNKLKETKVLQISATLPNPVQAQELAQFMAQQSVALNRAMAIESDRDSLDNARKQFEGAGKALEHARSGLAAATVSGSDAAAESELSALFELRGSLDETLAKTKGEAAEYGARPEEFARREVAALRAKARELAASKAEVERDIATKKAALSQRKARREGAEAEVRTRQAAYDQASKHYTDSSNAVGMRAEQLRILDPGIVPQRPSSPNVLLNVIAALAAAGVAAISFLTLQFGLDRQRARSARPASRWTA